MFHHLATLLLAGLVFAGMSLASEVSPMVSSSQVPYQVHDGYFESNRLPHKDNPSYLIITNRKDFDATFGVAMVMGAKPHFVSDDAFTRRMVVAVVKRGYQSFTYQVEKVTTDNGTLRVAYRATAPEGPSTATFASPLILSIPKGPYRTVVFVENGQEVKTVPMPSN